MRKTIYFLAAGLMTLTGCASNDEALCDDLTMDNTNPYFVSVNEAVEKAAPLFQSIKGETRSGKSSRITSVETISPASMTNTRSTDDTPLYYIVNYGKDEGFAILSADSRLLPVYAFSDEGSLSMEDALANNGLNMYISSLPGISDGSITLDPDFPVVTELLSYKGECTKPLLSQSVRNWHQWAPYNNLCYVANMEKAPVGCAALSIAMISSYFEYPYVCKGQTLSWKDYKNGQEDSNLYLYIADLGSRNNLRSKYSTDRTTTSKYNISQTFDNIGYDVTMAAMSEELMLNNINEAKKPVLLHGYSNDINQYWVVDGTYLMMRQHYGVINPETGKAEIESDCYWYYHSVWGENGKGNGYYVYKTETDSMGGNPDYLASGESKQPVPVFKDITMWYDLKRK